MEHIELINGSWVQTFTNILNVINNKLNNTEIDDIIRSIDERISDEEILQLCSIILNKLSTLSNDSTNLYGLVNFILNKINSMSVVSDKILDRVNSLSVVNQIIVRKPHCEERIHHYRKRCDIKRHNIIPKSIIEKELRDRCNDNKTFIMDMELKQGYTKQYEIIIKEGVHTYDWRLSWLISGNKRRLLWRDTLTSDIIEIYRKFGITDLEVINRSKQSTR